MPVPYAYAYAYLTDKCSVIGTCTHHNQTSLTKYVPKMERSPQNLRRRLQYQHTLSHLWFQISHT